MENSVAMAIAEGSVEVVCQAAVAIDTQSMQFEHVPDQEEGVEVSTQGVGVVAVVVCDFAVPVAGIEVALFGYVLPGFDFVVLLFVH